MSKEKRMPNAIELIARFESNLAFIMIAPAKVIVGIADSKIVTFAMVLNSKSIIITKRINIKGAKSVLQKITRIALL